jgi:alkaline phosphatase D
VYSGFSGEENPYQIGKVEAEKNFGLLQFDFTNNRVIMQIRGLEKILLGEHIQQY